MASLQRCFLISVSILLYKSPIPVQGRIIDAKPPSGKFDETKADAGKQKKYFMKEQPNFLFLLTLKSQSLFPWSGTTESKLMFGSSGNPTKRTENFKK